MKVKIKCFGVDINIIVAAQFVLVGKLAVCQYSIVSIEDYHSFKRVNPCIHSQEVYVANSGQTGLAL